MNTFKDHIKETLYLKAKKRVDEMGIKESLIVEASKNLFVTLRRAIDDIISENKKVEKGFERFLGYDSSWDEEKKSVKAFQQQAAVLEKSLARAAKDARAFYQAWPE